MVLGTSKKAVFLAAAVSLSVAPAFAWTQVSGLIQYGEAIDRERLELLESRQAMRISGDFEYFLTGDYTIRNRGGGHTATLGLLLAGVPWDFSTDVSDLQFYVDGRPVQHTVRPNGSGFEMGGYRQESFRLDEGTEWRLLDVRFPENSAVTIRVQYRTGGDVPISYNLAGNYFPNLGYWRGPTRFGVEITNEYMSGNNVEYYWIANIWFPSLRDSSMDSIFTMFYLHEMQGPETDLMRMQRPNGNTIRIEFTDKFMENYFRGFIIDIARWQSSGWPWDHQYLEMSYPSREILLAFLESIERQHLPPRPPNIGANISQRELAPYELLFLTRNQLRVMRNAFFARHGFVFQSKDLQQIFGSLQWYEPNPNFHEGLLTDIDRANIAVIQRLEALLGE